MDIRSVLLCQMTCSAPIDSNWLLKTCSYASQRHDIVRASTNLSQSATANVRFDAKVLHVPCTVPIPSVRFPANISFDFDLAINVDEC